MVATATIGSAPGDVDDDGVLDEVDNCDVRTDAFGTTLLTVLTVVG